MKWNEAKSKIRMILMLHHLSVSSWVKILS